LLNRVLEGGACLTQPRRSFGLFCAAILLCDLRPLAARALTSRQDFVSMAGPFSRQLAGPIFKI
jgi:hypothetical protein